MIALGVFLLLIGLAMIIRPTAVWFLAESWKNDVGAEPSSLYIWSTRFGGTILTLVGIATISIDFF